MEPLKKKGGKSRASKKIVGLMFILWKAAFTLMNSSNNTYTCTTFGHLQGISEHFEEKKFIAKILDIGQNQAAV